MSNGIKSTYVVPPALVEIWQPVTQRYLDKLKGATDDPGNLGVPDDHHLEPPAGQVSDEMHVKHSVVDVAHARHRVLWGENAAILSIVPLGQLVAKTWMENLENLPGFVQRQQ